jgi:CelD/BcsL family acetyltransferase involved in cellulose biosynthesis
VVCQAFLSAIADESALHLVELTDIPDESPLLEELETAVAEIGWRTQQWPAHKLCPVIDLPASWDDFMANLSRSVQKNYQYYRRRLQGQGAFLEIISNQAEMPEALAEFTRLHNSRRHQKQQKGIFSTSARKLFYKEMLQRFTAAGWVELAFLKVVDERVAGVCQFNYGNSIYYYQTGYDVTWEKYSVGFVLNGLLIERAIGAGRSCFEFLRGEEQYKYRLGATRNRYLRDIYLKRGSSLGEMYLARRKLSVGCRRLVRQSINCLKSPKSACDI